MGHSAAELNGMHLVHFKLQGEGDMDLGRCSFAMKMFILSFLLLPVTSQAQNASPLPLGPMDGNVDLQWQRKPMPPRGDAWAKATFNEQETLRKSFLLESTREGVALEIDSFIGSIQVAGTDSDRAELVVTKTFRANSKEALERARKEVSLDINQDRGLLKLVVNGKFRCQDTCMEPPGHEPYSVKMDFQIVVPRAIALKLRTVNEGDIRVSHVHGAYEIHNVDGNIDMQDIRGSGVARSVNGEVKIDFSENPEQASSFGTVNGNVELHFVKDLSADFRLKTFNGGIVSDFPLDSVPPQKDGEIRGGKMVLSANRYTEGRVGFGRPEIIVDTLNGNIRILERHE